jgi:hypothetical protein
MMEYGPHRLCIVFRKSNAQRDGKEPSFAMNGCETGSIRGEFLRVARIDKQRNIADD